MENGSWTGGIGILQRREVDVVSLSVAVRPDGRSLVIDQPMPIYRQGCQMAKFDPFLSLDCIRVEGVAEPSPKGQTPTIQRFCL